MEMEGSVSGSADAQAFVAPPVKYAPAKGTLGDFAESLLFEILLVLFATTFVLQTFKIPSESMEPTPFRPSTVSSWAITGTSALPGATGDLSIAVRSWVGPS
jgi:hypothetical protein